MYKLLALLFLSILAISEQSGNTTARNWGYIIDYESDKIVVPSEWKVNFPKCCGQFQSPIDIKLANTVYSDKLKQINIESSNNDIAEVWYMTNKAYSVKLQSNRNYKISVDSEEFEFLQMHFHWRGSEHKIDGRKFAGELHLVHRSILNPSMYAVIGFLFQLVDNDNQGLKPIIEKLQYIRNDGSSTYIDKLHLNVLVPLQVKDYYRYNGSFTTPGCDEVVKWIVTENPILGISEDQLLAFQMLRDKNGDPILTNSRPVQPVNDRLMVRSFLSGSRFNDAVSLKSVSVWKNLVYLAVVVAFMI